CACELRGDLAWDAGALGLGARLRALGDRLEPWHAADWLAILRYFQIANGAARDAAQAQPTEGVRLAAAAGALGDLRLGDATVVDGFTSAALVRRATGVDLRAGDGDASAEVVDADVLHDTMIAASATAPAGPL